MSRPKLDKIHFPRYKIKPETITKLQQIALNMGYSYGNTVGMGEFLDMIADIDPVVIQAIGKKKQRVHTKAIE
jgi:hypothetical protein